MASSPQAEVAEGEVEGVEAEEAGAVGQLRPSCFLQRRSERPL